MIASFLFFLGLAPTQATVRVDEGLEEGSYIIRNRAFASTEALPALGALSWTFKKSPSGHYSQLLGEGYGRDHYLPDADWRTHILWDLEKVSS